MSGAAPAWMEASARDFGERVEMLVLAFVDATRRRPKLFCDDAETAAGGTCVAFVDERFCEDDAAPALLELARHGARAWAVWTRGADPRAVALRMTVRPDAHGRVEVVIAIEPKTDAHLAELVARNVAAEARRRAGPAARWRVLRDVVFDPPTRSLVCGRCGATRAVERVVADDAVVSTPEETTWIRLHLACPEPAGSKADA